MTKNTLYSLSSKAVAAICYFTLDILVSRTLGYEGYNEWSFYFAVTTILIWLARFGIDASTRVHIARSAETPDKQTHYFISGIKIQLFVSFISCLLLFFLAPLLTKAIDRQHAYKNLSLLLMIGSVHISAYALLSTFKESYIGFLEFKKVLQITIAEFTFYLLFSIVGMHLGNLIGLTIGYSLSLCITVLLCFISEKSLLNPQKVKTAYPKEQKKILQYAFSLFFVNIGGLVLTEMDSLFLGIYSSNEVGIYTVAKNLVAKATHIPLAICISSIPAYAVITHSNYKEKLNGYLKLIIKYICLIITIIFLFAAFGKTAILFLYGEEYRVSVNILYLLLPYFAMYSLTTFISSFLSYQKRGHDLVIAHTIMIFSNFILNFLLIPIQGAKGAALATDLSILIFLLFMINCNIRCFKKLKNS